MRLGDLPCFSGTDLPHSIADLESNFLKQRVPEISTEHFGIRVEDTEWNLIADAVRTERERMSALEILIDHYGVVSAHGPGVFPMPDPYQSFQRKLLPFHQDCSIAESSRTFRVLQMLPSDRGPSEECTSFLPFTSYVRVLEETFTKGIRGLLSGRIGRKVNELERAYRNHTQNESTRNGIRSIRSELLANPKQNAKLWQKAEANGHMIHAPMGEGYCSAWSDDHVVHGVRSIRKPGSGRLKVIERFPAADIRSDRTVGAGEDV